MAKTSGKSKAGAISPASSKPLKAKSPKKGVNTRNVPRGTQPAEQTESFLNQIGKASRKYRFDNETSIQELADESGMSTVWISNLEKGKLENASLSSIFQFAKTIGSKINFSII